MVTWHDSIGSALGVGAAVIDVITVALEVADSVRAMARVSTAVGAVNRTESCAMVAVTQER